MCSRRNSGNYFLLKAEFLENNMLGLARVCPHVRTKEKQLFVLEVFWSLWTDKTCLYTK